MCQDFSVPADRSSLFFSHISVLLDLTSEDSAIGDLNIMDITGLCIALSNLIFEC